MFSLPKTWFQPLVGELRSHKLVGVAKKKKKSEQRKVRERSDKEIGKQHHLPLLSGRTKEGGGRTVVVGGWDMGGGDSCTVQARTLGRPPDRWEQEWQ